MLTDQQIIAKYGKPGDPDNITKITPPYPMRLAWDTTITVTKIQCHELIATPLLSALNDVFKHYGFAEIQRLRLDLFGGCFNPRLMRGSKNKLSRHSWGIALDFDPERNQWKWKKDKAHFAKPEYNAFFDIFEKHGFISLGRTKGYDWMHVEISK